MRSRIYMANIIRVTSKYYFGDKALLVLLIFFLTVYARTGLCVNSPDSKVWLAPFDLGIMQGVDVEFCPASDETGFLEIKIHLQRESGEVNVWRRVNKVFLNQLRKQLLMWRSLDKEAQRHYETIIASAGKVEVS